MKALFVLKGVRFWLKHRPIKTAKAMRRRRKEIAKVLDGKKTYGGVAILAVTGILMWAGLGAECTPEQLAEFGDACASPEAVATKIVTGLTLVGGTLLGVYGRWKATRGK